MRMLCRRNVWASIRVTHSYSSHLFLCVLVPCSLHIVFYSYPCNTTHTCTHTQSLLVQLVRASRCYQVAQKARVPSRMATLGRPLTESWWCVHTTLSRPYIELCVCVCVCMSVCSCVFVSVSVCVCVCVY